MPHVDIKCLPRNLTEQQLAALADDITAALVKHLGTTDDAVSVALNEIPSEKWKGDVYDTIIKPHLAELIKKPGYQY
ncbi:MULTISPECIES: tautomerase PptA [Pantoea]|uniref:Tautomerase PptA n=1 Tax=Pantoea cypripedii TaxID=55209 RepID=A0A1X1EL32_PANCY|nr:MULTISPECIES: tautomerase PptA [Pantoea]MBP2200023.1 4-oxalocrotonate tautomerase [Pantoea cypripedii]MDE1188149.1 tautomerase PptA [Pantoea sp.]ORM89635.1 Tautomerase PptA [Pantoea cypripedii]